VLTLPLLAQQPTTPAPQLTLLDGINLAAAMASIVLAVVALSLSLYLYVKGRDNEVRASSALSKIESQVGALEKLSGKMLDRLTKAVTDRSPEHEALEVVASAFKQLPDTLLAIGLQQPIRQTAPPEELISELISAMIGAYHYSGMSNVLLQFLILGFVEDKEDYKQTELFIEQSYQDVIYLERLLHSTDRALLEKNRLKNLYDAAFAGQRPFVKSALESYKKRTDYRAAAASGSGA